jgi:hypothetical protein
MAVVLSSGIEIDSTNHEKPEKLESNVSKGPRLIQVTNLRSLFFRHPKILRSVDNQNSDFIPELQFFCFIVVSLETSPVLV